MAIKINPKKYEKLPVKIQAVRITNENIKDVAIWCGGVSYSGAGTATSCIHIGTLEGTMIANVGDYVIEGVKGEYYPCRPDIFKETYIEVDDE